MNKDLMVCTTRCKFCGDLAEDCECPRIPVSDTIQLTDAEKNVVTTQTLARDIKGAFVMLGGLLKANKEYAYWSQSGYETWRDYIEQLGIGSYANAMRLIQIYKFVSVRMLSEADVYEIGMAKTMMLLPLAENGNLTEEVISLAKNGTARELRQQLGLKVPHNDSKHSVVCSRCGAEVIGAEWIKKDGHTTEDKTGGV